MNSIVKPKQFDSCQPFTLDAATARKIRRANSIAIRNRNIINLFGLGGHGEPVPAFAVSDSDKRVAG